ncbi:MULTISPECIES: zinc ribbon domain-containing protein [Morganellaceae]|uniref:Zinc ribbon domain-containing protein n=1 Tax=Proteus vulgaris TaxID=585 RepID=A0A6G6SP61_PROVU|nr:zinc ribbon domain-containing protein [Proteus vulgaris]
MLIFWILLSIIIGCVAASKDRSFLGWCLLSLVISPLISLIILLIVGEGNYAICPKCKEKVKSEASICKHCGTQFED